MRHDPVTATRTATPVIATIRDLLATGDRDRVQDAADAFLATLEPRTPHPVEPPHVGP